MRQYFKIAMWAYKPCNNAVANTFSSFFPVSAKDTHIGNGAV